MSALTILVVEDHEAVREFLGQFLVHYGFLGHLASEGPEAVELYRRHGAAIDVVLLDVQMPGEWDGPRTLAALRALDPGVPCCFMSGNTGRYSSEDLLALGAARVFPKPFADLGEVARVLRELAGRR